jgi:hypothetical protein
VEEIFLRRIFSLIAAAFVLTPFLSAQKTAAKPAPDVLVFTNGDQLTGHLVSAAGGNIVFKSDMAGQLTIGFDKIKELRSGKDSSEFALLRKGVHVNRHTPAPEGSISIHDGNVYVATDKPAANADSTSAPATVAAKDVNLIVSRKEFDRQVSGPHKFTEGWNGTLTAGASIVRSTTSATTFTAGLSLIRALPTVSWLPPRNRTTIDVNESYGKNTSPTNIPPIPGTPNPEVITLSSIFHADAERDEYVSPRFYALGDTSFDHNYAQGLQLQQVYGGGAGWTAVKDSKQELDLKVDVHYEKQEFHSGTFNGTVITPPANPNLIGSTIFEGYHRTLPRKMIFTQSLSILPAFNQVNDYSANASAALAIPVFKRFSASISTTDNFLNDPAYGYKKNSYQFVTGINYTLH